MSRFAFDWSLKRWLTTNPILLYFHRYGMPMGKVTRARVDHEGLHVTAELPRPEPGTEAANIWNLVKRGIIRAFSVGGHPTRTVINGVKTIVDWDIREISICPVGVNAGCLFTLTEQVGKAFGAVDDGGERVARFRYECDVLRDLSATMGALSTELRLADLRNRARARGPLLLKAHRASCTQMSPDTGVPAGPPSHGYGQGRGAEPSRESTQRSSSGPWRTSRRATVMTSLSS
jgi:HK97 family phage prohead protease